VGCAIAAMMSADRTILGFDRNVFLLGVTSLLNDTSSEMIYPLLPAFLTVVLGGGPATIGVIEGIAESTASLLKLLSGWLSDRFRRRKPLVLLGYATASLARPLVAVTTAPWQVLMVRMTDRVGKGLRSAPRDALLAESSHSSTWGRSFGFHRAMDHMGAVLGPLIAFVLVSGLNENYRVVFALAAIPGVLAILVVAIGVRDRAVKAPAAVPLALPRGPLPDTLLRFLFVVFVFTLGNSTDAFLLLRAQTLGVSVATLPLLWALLHIVKSLTSVPGGSLSDRIGRRRVIVLGWLVYAAVYVGFAAATTRLAIWCLFAAYGAFFGLTEGTEKALVADLVAPADRGAAFGFYHLTVGIAALPASLLFAVLWNWSGPGLAFAVGAGLAALAALLFLSLVPAARSTTGRQ
jgi:MFS family permease